MDMAIWIYRKLFLVEINSILMLYAHFKIIEVMFVWKKIEFV